MVMATAGMRGKKIIWGVFGEMGLCVRMDGRLVVVIKPEGSRRCPILYSEPICDPTPAILHRIHPADGPRHLGVLGQLIFNCWMTLR